jgi:hypothetical protein
MRSDWPTSDGSAERDERSPPAGVIRKRRHGCVVLARNIADFDLFQQLVPDGRAHSTVSDRAIAYQSKGPLPGSGPEPFVNYGWAQ